MSEFEVQLYRNLMALVNSTEVFFFKDVEAFNTTFRIFNYRLASYSDFQKPGALECRGHMFEMRYGRPVRLASLPIEKFFNLYENPFTENVDFSQTKMIQVKADGSLISTFNVDGDLHVKSKASLDSDQAIDALTWLRLPENEQLYREIKEYTIQGATVNMEWTSPNNRIVLGYDKDRLNILNVRDNKTGDYINIFPESEVYRYLVGKIDHLRSKEIKEFVATIPKMQHIEGFVVTLRSGQKIKIKTEWYLERHKAKDGINHPRRLFEAVVTECADDLRTMFHDDALSLARIKNMEDLVEPQFNHMVSTVEKFFADNKNLSRKDYAIKATKLKDGYMPLYMNAYLRRKVDYKNFAVRNYKRFIGDIDEDQNTV